MVIYTVVYIIVKRRGILQTAKLFSNGRSQAVRLPKECRFEGDEVYIRKLGDIVILVSKDEPWAPLIDGLDLFSDDFLAERSEPVEEQTRETL